MQAWLYVVNKPIIFIFGNTSSYDFKNKKKAQMNLKNHIRWAKGTVLSYLNLFIYFGEQQQLILYTYGVCGAFYFI